MINSNNVNTTNAYGKDNSGMDLRTGTGYSTYQAFYNCSSKHITRFYDVPDFKTCFCNYVSNCIDYESGSAVPALINIRRKEVKLESYYFFYNKRKFDNAYLVAHGASSSDNVNLYLINCYTDADASWIVNNQAIDTSSLHLNNELILCDISFVLIGDCHGNVTPDNKYSPTVEFSRTDFFSKSLDFSYTKYFSKSNEFSKTVYFSESFDFSNSNFFTIAKNLTKISDFSQTNLYFLSHFPFQYLIIFQQLRKKMILVIVKRKIKVQMLY